MKIDWWWVVVAAAIAWFWSRQREQNLVAENAAQFYRSTHPLDPATAPPGVLYDAGIAAAAMGPAPDQTAILKSTVSKLFGTKELAPNKAAPRIIA